MLPVEMIEIGMRASREPSRTMEPLPNCFSICERASSTALARSSATAIGHVSLCGPQNRACAHGCSNRAAHSAHLGTFAVSRISLRVIGESDCNKLQITKESVEMAKLMT